MSDVTFWKRSPCYLSTPEHLRSFVGLFFYIYTAKGELCLTETALGFIGRSGVSVDISLDSIVNVSVGHYSRWAKPARLDYIAISYQNGGTERTTLFTPTRSWATPVWETNKIVADWVDTLETACSRYADCDEKQSVMLEGGPSLWQLQKDIEQLKQANAELRDAVKRLQGEVERLTGTGKDFGITEIKRLS
jgi:hypothetical protein